MGSQCPKCHQPIEEDYICCADIEFQWKCERCQKRSRGFALPFGQCQLCGGKLVRVDSPESPQATQLLALQEAFQIEVSACHFYHHLAESVDDPQVSDFFESLSNMEKEHAGELAKKYHLHIDDAALYEPLRHPLPEPFFEDLCFYDNTGDISRLYDCAIALEKRTYDFFSKKSAQFPKGPEKNLYLELAAEEQDHIALLQSERDRSEPHPG